MAGSTDNTLIRRIAPWAVALASAVLAIALRPWISEYIGAQTAYYLAVPAVALSAAYGGWWPGLATAVLCIAGLGASIELGLMPGTYFGQRTVAFVIASLAICGFAERLHRARRQARAHAAHSDQLLAELRSSREHLQLHVDNSEQLVWLKNGQGRYVFANRAACAAAGVDCADLIDKTDADVLAPERAAAAAAAEQEVRRTRAPVTQDSVQIGARVFRMVRFPVALPDGQVGIGATGLDVTELTDSQARLSRSLAAAQEREHAYRQAMDTVDILLSQTPLAVVMFDREFKVTRWTGQAENMFGWHADEAVGRDFGALALVHPDDAHKVERAARRLREQRVSVASFNRNLRKDGEIIWCEWYNSVMLDEHGEMATVLSLVLDVTERELGERALLDVSRITHNRLELKHARHSIQQIVGAAAEQSGPGLRDAGQHLVVDAPPQPLWVWGDRERLVQVFTNLLNNSAKYADGAGTVTVRISSAGERALIQVTDQGIGIPPTHQEQVFELFARTDTRAHRQRGGLGIGLSLVKSIVELHGGTVSAYSAGLGHGALMTVWLPLCAAPELAPVEPAPAADAARAAATEQRVLVIDDNQDGALSLAQLLEQLGYVCETAFTGQGGLDAAAQRTPDIVVLDIGLPDMSGYDAARALRAGPDGAHLYLVALTGYGRAEDRAQALAAGCDAHLIKPVEVDSLLAVLQQRTEGARQVA